MKIFRNIVLFLVVASCSRPEAQDSLDWKIDIQSGKSVIRRSDVAMSSSEIVSKDLNEKYSVMVFSSFYKDGTDSNTDLITVSIMEKSHDSLNPVLTRYFPSNEKLKNEMIASKAKIIELNLDSLKISFGEHSMLIKLPADLSDGE